MTQSFIYIGNMKAGMQLSQKLVDAGMQVASEIESADVVVTYLLGSSNQEDAFFGTDGIVARANAGTCIVDLSPTTPLFARELQAMAAVNGIHMVEAPMLVHDITLRDAFSKAGNLSLFVSGDSADIEAASRVLHTISPDQQWCGQAGQAQVARCCSTMVRISQIAALMEAHALVSCMSDARTDALERALEVGDAPDWVKALAHAAKTHAFDGSYTVEMAYAEVSSAMDAAEEVGLVAPHGEAAEYLIEMLCTIGGADLSIAALGLVYEEEAVAAEYGLDWRLAEGLYAFEHGHSSEHHDHGFASGSEDGYDEGDFFGDYSAN